MPVAKFSVWLKPVNGGGPGDGEGAGRVEVHVRHPGPTLPVSSLVLLNSSGTTPGVWRLVAGNKQTVARGVFIFFGACEKRFLKRERGRSYVGSTTGLQGWFVCFHGQQHKKERAGQKWKYSVLIRTGRPAAVQRKRHTGVAAQPRRIAAQRCPLRNRISSRTSMYSHT